MRIIDRESMERASIKDLAKYGIKVKSLNLLSVSDRGEAKERMKDAGLEKDETYVQLVWEYLELFTGIDEDVKQEVLTYIMEVGPTLNDFRLRVRRTVLMIMRNKQRDDISLHMHEITPLVDPDEDFTLKEVLSAESSSLISGIMTTDILTDVEKKILTMRFGLDGGDDRTLQECADVLGRSRQRIRQIEAKALRKLRRPSTIRRFNLSPMERSESRKRKATEMDIYRLSRRFKRNDVLEIRRMFIEDTFKSEVHDYWWIHEDDLHLITDNLVFQDQFYNPDMPMTQFVAFKFGRGIIDFKNLKRGDHFALYYPNGERYSSEDKVTFDAASDAYVDEETGELTIDINE